MGITNSNGPLFQKIPKRRGLTWKKYIFSCMPGDGDSCDFFVEYVAVNPALSPDEAVFNKIDAVSGEFAEPENRPPSYLLVRAGRFGQHGSIFEAFLPSGGLSLNSNENRICFGDKYLLTHDRIAGSIIQKSVIYSLFSDTAGTDTFSWNLRLKETNAGHASLRTGGSRWQSANSRVFLDGKLGMNNDSLRLSNTPGICFSDTFFCKEIPEYWFHVSGMKLRSKITNAILESSSIIAQSFEPHSVAVTLNLGGRLLTFKPSNPNQTTYCVKTDDNIHWTLSAETGAYMLDLDVFCSPLEMKLCTYDAPAGGGEVLSLISGVAGTGEVRLYKRLRKGLELIEHAGITSARCEYGAKDTAER